LHLSSTKSVGPKLTNPPIYTTPGIPSTILRRPVTHSHDLDAQGSTPGLCLRQNFAPCASCRAIGTPCLRHSMLREYHGENLHGHVLSPWSPLLGFIRVEKRMSGEVVCSRRFSCISFAITVLQTHSHHGRERHQKRGHGAYAHGERHADQ
jgi:hypothetical protein